MTPIERETHGEVIRLERELDDKITALEAQVDVVRKRLAEHRLHADGNERLLLTATDDELVQAIAKALRQFGHGRGWRTFALPTPTGPPSAR
jgi:hypothetical protein